MKTLVQCTLVLLFLAGIAWISYHPAVKYWKQRNRIHWDTEPVERGDVTRFVNSTGTIRPVRSVSVGSFVSGPIVELNVDFNDEVRSGEVMARVDPRLFLADVSRDEATLATRQAELERIEAQLLQANNNHERGKKLFAKSEGFLSAREMDELVFDVRSLEAQIKVAEAMIQQAQANLENARANLNYCEIRAPVDGMVIDRKIDPGQTLAAQFQTPELFVVAPDLREKVHVFASVDEADIGLVQKSKADSRPVTFTVESHPGEIFHGEIEQIRVSSEDNQNVVTYPVVIATTNPDMKLLPGMTASVSFEVDAAPDVIKIPNTALRFFPEDAKQVREVDRHLIDGSTWRNEKRDSGEASRFSAEERAEKRRGRNRRHVWVAGEQWLRAVEIETGISESGFTALVAGELDEGDKLVTGKKEGN